jgi:4-hydroxy-tetrahydrodipicolinate synthase
LFIATVQSYTRVHVAFFATDGVNTATQTEEKVATISSMTNNQKRRLKGVLAPVLTPFGPDLAPDAPRFVQHCQWLLSQGVGLAMFGTNSEGNSLSLAEKCGLLDALIAAGIPMDRAMPGTGSCSLTDAVVMTSASVQAGSAGALVLPPFYYKGTGDDGLFRFFAELIERVGDTRLRVYLYPIEIYMESCGMSWDVMGRYLLFKII